MIIWQGYAALGRSVAASQDVEEANARIYYVYGTETGQSGEELEIQIMHEYYMCF